MKHLQTFESYSYGGSYGMTNEEIKWLSNLFGGGKEKKEAQKTAEGDKSVEAFSQTPEGKEAIANVSKAVEGSFLQKIINFFKKPGKAQEIQEELSDKAGKAQNQGDMKTEGLISGLTNVIKWAVKNLMSLIGLALSATGIGVIVNALSAYFTFTGVSTMASWSLIVGGGFVTALVGICLLAAGIYKATNK